MEVTACLHEPRGLPWRAAKLRDRCSRGRTGRVWRVAGISAEERREQMQRGLLGPALFSLCRLNTGEVQEAYLEPG